MRQKARNVKVMYSCQSGKIANVEYLRSGLFATNQKKSFQSHSKHSNWYFALNWLFTISFNNVNLSFFSSLAFYAFDKGSVSYNVLLLKNCHTWGKRKLARWSLQLFGFQLRMSKIADLVKKLAKVVFTLEIWVARPVTSVCEVWWAVGFIKKACCYMAKVYMCTTIWISLRKAYDVHLQTSMSFALFLISSSIVHFVDNNGVF